MSVTCPKCGKSLTTESQLKSHIDSNPCREAVAAKAALAAESKKVEDAKAELAAISDGGIDDLFDVGSEKRGNSANLGGEAMTLSQDKGESVGKSDEDIRREKLAEKRRNRESFNVHQPSMTVKAGEGMHGHWFNDVGNNIQRRLKQGYEVVGTQEKVGERSEDLNTDLGSGMSLVTGTKVDGSPQRSYYMEIEQELYGEDQAAKQSKIDEVDKLIHAGKFKNDLGEHGYVAPR